MPPEPGPALPQTCCPTVWLWPGQALYAGPGLGLEPHSGSVWCLAVGVDGPLTVTLQGSATVARSVLIPPRLTHHLSMQGGLVSSYLDPSSQRSASCRQQFTEFRDGIGVVHAAETRLTAMPEDDDAARRWLDLAAPDTPTGSTPGSNWWPSRFARTPPQRYPHVNWQPPRVSPNPGSCTCSAAKQGPVCGATGSGAGSLRPGLPWRPARI